MSVGEKQIKELQETADLLSLYLSNKVYCLVHRQIWCKQTNSVTKRAL